VDPVRIILLAVERYDFGASRGREANPRLAPKS
jgi:hypothetical protein